MTLTLPKTCTYCDEKLRKNARNCEACGAFYEVRETAIGSMYAMAGLFSAAVLMFGNASFQMLKTDEPVDLVIQIVFPIIALGLAPISWWFFKQARGPREWTEWTKGAPEFADMKILEAGGTLPEQGKVT